MILTISSILAELQSTLDAVKRAGGLLCWLESANAKEIFQIEADSETFCLAVRFRNFDEEASPLGLIEAEGPLEGDAIAYTLEQFLIEVGVSDSVIQRFAVEEIGLDNLTFLSALDLSHLGIEDEEQQRKIMNIKHPMEAAARAKKQKRLNMWRSTVIKTCELKDALLALQQRCCAQDDKQAKLLAIGRPRLASHAWTLELNDQHTQKHIRVPVRGDECEHNECFELAAYQQSNNYREVSLCPICAKPTSAASLHLDELVLRLVASVPPNTRQVSFWPVEEKYQIRNQTNKSVVNLDSGDDYDSDDDDGEDEANRHLFLDLAKVNIPSAVALTVESKISRATAAEVIDSFSVEDLACIEGVGVRVAQAIILSWSRDHRYV